MFEPGTYRHWVKDKNLIAFNIVVKETDLYIRASINLKRKALKLVEMMDVAQYTSSVCHDTLLYSSIGGGTALSITATGAG